MSCNFGDKRWGKSEVRKDETDKYASKVQTTWCNPPTTLSLPASTDQSMNWQNFQLTNQEDLSNINKAPKSLNSSGGFETISLDNTGKINLLLSVTIVLKAHTEVTEKNTKLLWKQGSLIKKAFSTHVRKILRVLPRRKTTWLEVAAEMAVVDRGKIRRGDRQQGGCITCQINNKHNYPQIWHFRYVHKIFFCLACLGVCFRQWNFPKWFKKVYLRSVCQTHRSRVLLMYEVPLKGNNQWRLIIHLFDLPYCSYPNIPYNRILTVIVLPYYNYIFS